MDLVLFSAIPKIALFFLLLVGAAIIAELLYLAKKKIDSPEVTLPQSFARPAMVAVTTEIISETPKKGRFSRKTTMVILSTLLIALTIPVGLALVKQRQSVEKQAAVCTPGEKKDFKCICLTDVCLPSSVEEVCYGEGNGAYWASVTTNGDPACKNACNGLCPVAAVCTPGEYKRTCTGQCGGCAADAGEAKIEQCKSDGTGFEDKGSECRTECVGACTGGGGTGSCQYNSNYSAGLLPDKPNPDPGCGTQGGIYCNNSSVNVCCYSDRQCFQGQQGYCTDLGNGSIRLGAGATDIVDYWCPSQPAPGPCSENRVSRGGQPAGDYSVNERGCGGLQIDAIGLCGSKKFVPCAGGATPTPTPTPTPGSFSASCSGIGLSDSNWSPITNLNSLTVDQVVYFTVNGITNEPGGLTKARFRINADGNWQETTQKRGSNFYIQYTIAAAGTYAIEAEVFNPALGWK